MSKALAKSIGDVVSGKVLGDPDELDRYATNFGGHFHARPGAVLLASSAEDVAQALLVARRLETPVAFRGNGHSAGRHGLAASGLVIVRADVDPLLFLDRDRIEVSAGSTWAAVEAELQRRGRTMPVRTNEGATTVGGTLSAGGFGLSSVSAGAQVDHVTRLRVILADGTSAWHERRSEIGRLALAGQGQIGVIDRVELTTVPHRPWALADIVPHPSLAAALDVMSRLARPEEAAIELRGGRWITIVLERAATQETAAHFLADEARALPQRGDDEVHLWNDYCLDGEQIEAFTAEVEALIPGRPFLERAHLLPLAGPIDDVRGPFDVRTWATGELGFGVGVYFSIPKGERAVIAETEAIHQRLLTRCLALGGRPYACGSARLAGLDRAAIYGEAQVRLAARRRALDPLGLLNRELF